jgi:hypothetical protein
MQAARMRCCSFDVTSASYLFVVRYLSYVCHFLHQECTSIKMCAAYASIVDLVRLIIHLIKFTSKISAFFATTCNRRKSPLSGFFSSDKHHT